MKSIRQFVAVTLFLALFAAAASAQRDDRKLPEGVTVERNITYATVDDVELKLDLYLPKSPEQERPVLVWIHGGGWRGGNRADCPLVWLTGEGYAVASISYRFTDVAIYPAQIHDCKGAIRWLRANAEKHKLDVSRIGVAGASAGGHLAALLGTTGGVFELEGSVGGNTSHSSRVQAVLDVFGPSDLIAFAETKPRKDVLGLLELLVGGPISEKADLAKLASPVHHLTADDAPLLILHGDKDSIVPLSQSEILDKAYKEKGLTSTLVVIRGAEHGGPLFFDDVRRKKAQDFFNEHVKTTKPKAEEKERTNDE